MCQSTLCPEVVQLSFKLNNEFLKAYRNSVTLQSYTQEKRNLSFFIQRFNVDFIGLHVLDPEKEQNSLHPQFLWVGVYILNL
jgi:hypothetical protein